ncbi:unnamed protein product [Macrosiphum euphorbiae]|uniref:Uncharacterized protein n=1 Tax=Macrosiphum euphorbiae TaxID=13131 RepID=A0AAV0WXM4_9HEMI|nr:unnamed protein product [Macrosiphum euphorbiae]
MNTDYHDNTIDENDHVEPLAAAGTSSTGVPPLTDFGLPTQGRVLSAVVSRADLTGLDRRRRSKRRPIRRSASAVEMYGHSKVSLVDLLRASDEPQGDRSTTSGHRWTKLLCLLRNPFRLCCPREEPSSPDCHSPTEENMAETTPSHRLDIV